MNALLLISRCVLALVFLVAAVGKLVDLAGSRQALSDFGVPDPIARVAGPLLPLTELLVAAALVIRPSAVGGAIGAIVLLLVFVVGVAYAMSQDRAPDCHCFGQIHSEPAGRSTLIRNAGLLLPALLITVGGSGPPINTAIGNLRGAQIGLVVTAVLAAVLALVVSWLWSERRRLEAELERARSVKSPPGLPRGTAAPDSDLIAVRGETGSLSELFGRGRPAVLVFVSTTCGPCLALLPILNGWQRSLSGALALPAIFSGEQAEIERLSAEYGLELSLAQSANEVFSLYALRATPSAVLIDGRGIISAAPAEGVPAIESLVRSALRPGAGMNADAEPSPA